MDNVLGWDIVASEFEPQSSYYIHFRSNILGKVMDSITQPAEG